MASRALLSLVAAGALAFAGSAQAASVAEWRADIDAIVADLRLNHPDAFTKTGELTFRREAAALKAALPELSEEQRVVRVMRLVALVGDGHTSLEPDNPAFGQWYPFRLYEFTDGYFVVSAHVSAADLAGAQVLEIGGRPAAEAAEAARDLMGADNAFDRKERLFALSNAGLMRGLGYAGADRSLKLRVKQANGRVVERTLTPRATDAQGYKPADSTFEWRFRAETGGPGIGTNDDWISAYRGLKHSAFRTPDLSRPAHLTFRRAHLARPMPEKDAYYIQLNCVCDGADETLLGFIARAMKEVDAQKPRRLIVDIRYNFGGDGSKVPALLREFIRREGSGAWKELYVLSGRRTFSAGVMLLDAFMIQTEESVVGEPAGAALNSYGDANSVAFPRTGLHMYRSTLRHELGRSTDISPFIQVDVSAQFSFADYAGGRDPAVDAIASGEEMRALPIVAREQGGAAAKRVYEARKARFGKLGWWVAASDDDMTKAAYALLDAGRTADAIEVFRINTEIHPDFWRGWHNLGQAQLKAGQREAGLENYRRALEADPNNPQSAQQREELAKGVAK
jgi:tetratricopeptide (TPR) repeat protein